MASPTPASAASNKAPALSTPAKAHHPAASPIPPVSGAGGNTTTTTTAAAATPSTADGGSPSKRGHKHTFGVLKTGYLEKMNPARGVLDKPKKRFVVLTHESLHWFRREEGYDLFGEERGSISVQELSKVELVKAAGDGGSSSPAGGLDAFQVSCKQDIVRRVFRAASPEEAQAWVAAVKAAIKARSLYRRETLQGISFLPHGAHDAAHEEPPLVSAVTLRRAGERHELVLAKGPHYHYGHLFELPYLAPAAGASTTPSGSPSLAAATTSSSSSSSSSPRPIITPTPRANAATATTPTDDDVLCILLSNGDSAEVPVRALADCAVGGTVQAKVASLAGHAAHLPLTVEACYRPQEPQGPTAEAEKKKSTMMPVWLLDAAAPALAAVLLGAWAQEAEQRAGGGAALAPLSKERLALLVLAALGLLRAALGALAARKGRQQAMAAAAGRRMVLKVSVDDYVHDARGRGESKGQEAEEEALPPIPQRFINGCFGDMVEAERRWRVTLAWRAEFGTDAILEQEHPYYDVIKEALPHFYCKTGKDGNPVYIERSGQTDLAKMRQAGLDWLVWHYIHNTEYVFRELYPSEAAKTITIFDVAGLGMNAILGEPLEFIRRASHLMQEHYPERCKVIIIVNTPGWFNFCWRMIRPMVNETTQKKIKIVPAGRETTEAIAEFVDIENIPVEYGGKLSYGDGPDSCRWNSPEEVALREHVYAVNKRFADARAAQGLPTPARFEPPNGMAAGKHHH